MSELKELAQAAVKIADAERAVDLIALQNLYYSLRGLVLRLCPLMEQDLPASVEGCSFTEVVFLCGTARLRIEPALGYEFWAWKQRQQDEALGRVQS